MKWSEFRDTANGLAQGSAEGDPAFGWQSQEYRNSPPCHSL